MEQAFNLSQFGLWVFALVQFVLYGVFLRIVGRFLKQVRLQAPTVKRTALTVSQMAPPFRAVDQAGRTVEVGPKQKRATLVLFIRHTCMVCHQIIPRLKEVQERYPELQLVVIGSEEGEGETDRLHDDVSFIRSNAIRQAYFVKYVPAMVMLGHDSRVLAISRAVSVGDFESRLERFARAGFFRFERIK
jgi:hypothetical protein